MSRKPTLTDEAYSAIQEKFTTCEYILKYVEGMKIKWQVRMMTRRYDRAVMRGGWWGFIHQAVTEARWHKLSDDPAEWSSSAVMVTSRDHLGPRVAIAFYDRAIHGKWMLSQSDPNESLWFQPTHYKEMPVLYNLWMEGVDEDPTRAYR